MRSIAKTKKIRFIYHIVHNEHSLETNYKIYACIYIVNNELTLKAIPIPPLQQSVLAKIIAGKSPLLESSFGSGATVVFTEIIKKGWLAKLPPQENSVQACQDQ